MNSYKLKIITPEKTFFDGETTQIVVRTSEGDTGILAGHIDYVSNILTGPLRVKQENGEYRTAAVAEGIIIVSNGEVTVLPQSAEWADEIDLERAESAKHRCKKPSGNLFHVRRQGRGDRSCGKAECIQCDN